MMKTAKRLLQSNRLTQGALGCTFVRSRLSDGTIIRRKSRVRLFLELKLLFNNYKRAVKNAALLVAQYIARYTGEQPPFSKKVRSVASLLVKKATSHVWVMKDRGGEPIASGQKGFHAADEVWFRIRDYARPHVKVVLFSGV